MKLGIIITCKNLVEYTKAAVESVFTSHPYVLFVVDDGSTDATKWWLREAAEEDHRIVPVLNPKSKGLSGKWNVGCQLAFEEHECDMALICNNDILFSPVTIDSLVARMRKGDVGMVTAHNMRGEMAVPTDVLNLGVSWEPTEAPNPDFSCFLLSKDTYDKVGPFDEKFVPCYFEDGDYHLRMGKLGIKAITTTGAPYYHYGSRTQNSVYGGLCTPEQFDKLREYLRSKHGTVPGEADYDKICRGE